MSDGSYFQHRPLNVDWRSVMFLLLFLLGETCAKRVSTKAAGPIVLEPSGKWHGDDGPWSSFLLHVGSPGQDVNVLPDPYRSALVLVDPEGCPPDPRLPDCVRNRGGVYKRGDSDTWNRSSKHTWDGGELHVAPALTRDPMGHRPVESNSTNKVGIDRVGGESNGRSWVVPEQGILSTSEMRPFVGLLGLATNVNSTARNPTSLFDNIRGQAKQRSVSWSYTAGRANEAPGSLVLGGYDASRLNRSTTVMSSMHRHDRLFATWLGDITVNDPSQQTKSFQQPRMAVDMDFSSPYLFLPMEVCVYFENAFGIKWDHYNRLYTVDDVKHNELVARNVSISFSIHGDSGKQDFVVPYKSLVLAATFPKLAQSVRYFALQRAFGGFFSLGRAFLQEAHLTAVFDHPDGAYFNLSQAQYYPNRPPQIVEIVSPKRVHKKLAQSTWIALGVTCGVLLCVILALLWAKAFKCGPFAKRKLQGSEDIEFGSRVNLRRDAAPGASSAEPNDHDDAASTKGSIYYEAISDIKEGEGSKDAESHETDLRPEPDKKKHHYK